MKIYKQYVLLYLFFLILFVVNFFKLQEQKNDISIVPLNMDFCIDFNQNKKIMLDTSMSFLHLLKFLPVENVPFKGNDTDIIFYDLDFDCNTTPSYLERKFLKYLTIIPENFLSDTGCYCTSRLRVIRGMNINGIPLIFYMQGGWEKSRSLVFAVLDSVGNEISSKILVTDDCSLDAYKDSNKLLFKHSIYTIDTSSIKIDVFSGSYYGDPKVQKSHIVFSVDGEGKIKKVR